MKETSTMKETACLSTNVPNSVSPMALPVCLQQPQQPSEMQFVTLSKASFLDLIAT